MSKYEFHRMGSETFEHMVQALLENRRRGFGALIQFGPGADGAREATWLQPPDHPEYTRPTNATSDVAKKWVFQVKFHEIGLRGWAGAGAAVVSDLKSELEKLTVKHSVACDHYVLITNVPLSGARRIGTRDQLIKIAEEWQNRVSAVEVWDAVDLSRMLDNNTDVRTAYDELILPGDVIAAIYRQMQFQVNRRESTFRGYLQYLVTNESEARADEAGDEDPLPLSRVFVDQTLRLDKESIPEGYRDVIEGWVSTMHREPRIESITPTDLDAVSSSYALLLAPHDKLMLLAGPGYGKSTITQFLALYHASRILSPDYARRLAERLKLPAGILPETLDAFCEMRFPFRIELRRYSKWRRSLSGDREPLGLATYIVRELIGKNVASNLVEDDVFELASRNPILIILDGLDEVPNKESRDEILKDCDAFIFRCSGENADLQIVMSSRPQGYNGEFDRFEPVRWRINDLSGEDFKTYCNAWLHERIKNADECLEAEERLSRGMESEAVRRLATTLLQTTVMLTIVRRKSDIPGERHKLFAKYVDVVFEREKAKIEIISLYERELRRLHEMVGYRLHEAIGRGDEGPVPADRFRNYVREVWHLLRGDEHFEGVPNLECNKIVELATNRLVFLSGKGERQTDIDFVIQPYREYFAALYLSNHTEAEPDKVYDCLVERGPFWLNVLQFYVALAKPAQQFAWIHHAIERPQAKGGIERLVLEVQYQRATLATLAEYGDLPQAHFQKGISVALPLVNWWMWVGQDWAISIVRSIRSGDVWRELLRAAQRIENPSAAFVLWLLPRVVPASSSEYHALGALVSRLLKLPGFCQEAVAATLLYDLPVNLTEEHEEAVITVLSEFPFQRSLQAKAKTGTEIFRRLPRSTLLHLICSRASHMPALGNLTDPWRFLELPVETRNLEVVEFSPSAEQIGVTQPLWTRIRVANQEILRLNVINESNAHERYLHGLFEALRRPDDVDSDLRARKLEAALPSEPSWAIGSFAVLGPSPAEFSCKEDWIAYKNGVKEFFNDSEGVKELTSLLMTYLQPAAESTHSWTTLLVHPKHWEMLLTVGLISATELNRLRACKWATLMGLPNRLIEFYQCHSYGYYLDRRRQTLPLLAILKVAVLLHNGGHLDESTVAVTILYEADPSNLTGDDMNELISSIQNPASLPTSWAQIIVSFAASTSDIDTHRLAELWRALNQVKPIHLLFAHPVDGTTPKVVMALLETEDKDSVNLAAAIIRQLHELEESASLTINRKLAHAIRKLGIASANQVYALCRTRATISEMELYSDAVWCGAAAALSSHMAPRIAERIVSMPHALPRSDYTELSASLAKIIEGAKGFPDVIAVAAINAITQLDVMSREPLNELMWQSGPIN